MTMANSNDKILFNQGRHWRAKLGFILLPNELTIETDLFMMKPEGVGLFFSRGHMPREINVNNLTTMADSLASSAASILPNENIDIICYACTSGSVVVGEDKVIKEINRGAPNTKATTLVTGVIEALNILGIKRIVVGTPYIEEINKIEKDYLEKQNFKVLDIHGLNLHYDTEISTVAPEYLIDFAQQIDRPDAEAIFISCGALRTIEVIDKIESMVCKPVISSNQAMFWHCLRLAGIQDKIQGYGKLFQEY
jgi:maleate isomerase